MRRLISRKWANRVHAFPRAFLPSFLSVSTFFHLSLAFQYLSFLFIFVLFFLPFSQILVILLWEHSFFFPNAKRTSSAALLPSLLTLRLPPLALGPTHGSWLNAFLVSGLLGAIRTAAATWLALASPLSRQSLIAPQFHLLGGEGLTGSNFWILGLGL